MPNPKDSLTLDGALPQGVVHRKLTRKLVLFFLLVAAILFLGVYVHQHKVAITAKLNSLKLLPQKETFTELYIDDFAALTTKLPTAIEPNTKILFSFSVHNLEGRSMQYPYEVYVIDQATGTTTIDQNILEIKDGGTLSVDEKYIFPAASTGAAVYIQLLEPNQSIHFFVPAKT